MHCKLNFWRVKIFKQLSVMTSPCTPSIHAVTSENSPTDRVEKLLRKYKSRQAASCKLQGTERTPDNSSKELDLWNALNNELQAEGFKSVLFTRPTASQDGYLMLSLSSSAAMRDTIYSLLKRQKSIVQDLPSSSTPHTPHVSFQPSTPGESTDDEDTPPRQSSIAQHLQSQVAKLKYENAKLKVDLRNRPELYEMHRCQKIVKELEKEFEQTKSLLSMEQADLLQSQKHIKHACSLLQVSNSGEMLPKLSEMVDGRKQLETRLTSVVSIVHPPSSVKCSRRSSSLTDDITRHNILCEITWDHVILTLQEWQEHLKGFKELEQVIADVCLHLKLSSCKESVVTGKETTDVSSRDGELTCAEMAELLRNWLLEKGHLKHASSKLLIAMVKHFQHLFGVPKLSGVYPAMSRLYQQVEETKNIMKHLKCSLELDVDCSNRQLMSTVEYLAAEENRQLLMAIHNDFGSTDTLEVLEKLHLCGEFFPAFQTVITHLLDLLGVESLNGIIPAVHDLKAAIAEHQ